MFGFKKDKTTSEPPQLPEKPGGFLTRLKEGLTKTRAGLTQGLNQLFLGKKAIDETLLEDFETRLLCADVGVEATQEIIAKLTGRMARKQLNDAQALHHALVEDMSSLLAPYEKSLGEKILVSNNQRPHVILMIGVNGAGKTTTIGKLAHRFKHQGFSVMLAAGDTFRAAAVEQLQAWGERNQIPVIAQGPGADPAAVIFDALQSAKAKGMDILLADTAGRLHTQSNLMDELKKIKRVMAKLDSSAPHDVVLVLDATNGQNAISQAKLFNAALGVTGIILTKMDGTAKGGVIFAIAKQLQLPIHLIGVGESIDDLRDFNAHEFVSALLGEAPADDT